MPRRVAMEAVHARRSGMKRIRFPLRSHSSRHYLYDQHHRNAALAVFTLFDFVFRSYAPCFLSSDHLYTR